MKTLLIFDWGNTLMRDFPNFEGPMAFWPKVEVVRDADFVLRCLYGKCTLCVATNAGVSDTVLMNKALDRGGIGKYFSYYFSSKDLGYAKPDPAFFNEILSQTGYHPSDSVMIGNDYVKDIVGAKLSGLTTVFFNEERMQGDYPYADYTIKGLIELPDILIKIT